jgi:hypothetical protein
LLVKEYGILEGLRKLACVKAFADCGALAREEGGLSTFALSLEMSDLMEEEAQKSKTAQATITRHKPMGRLRQQMTRSPNPRNLLKEQWKMSRI